MPIPMFNFNPGMKRPTAQGGPVFGGQGTPQPPAGGAGPSAPPNPMRPLAPGLHPQRSPGRGPRPVQRGGYGRLLA